MSRHNIVIIHHWERMLNRHPRFLEIHCRRGGRSRGRKSHLTRSLVASEGWSLVRDRTNRKHCPSPKIWSYKRDGRWCGWSFDRHGFYCTCITRNMPCCSAVLLADDSRCCKVLLVSSKHAHRAAYGAGTRLPRGHIL